MARQSGAAFLRQYAIDGLKVVGQLFTLSICLLPVQLLAYGVDAGLPNAPIARGLLFVALVPVAILWLGFAYPRAQHNLWGRRSTDHVTPANSNPAHASKSP